jgi:hypothetical protein
MYVKAKKIILSIVILLIPGILLVIMSQKNKNFYGFFPLWFGVFLGFILDETQYVVSLTETTECIYLHAGFWCKELKKDKLVVKDINIPFGDRPWICININDKNYNIILNSKCKGCLIDFVNISYATERYKKHIVQHINNKIT